MVKQIIKKYMHYFSVEEKALAMTDGTVVICYDSQDRLGKKTWVVFVKFMGMDLVQLGIFWKLEHADLFADAYLTAYDYIKARENAIANSSYPSEEDKPVIKEITVSAVIDYLDSLLKLFKIEKNSEPALIVVPAPIYYYASQGWRSSLVKILPGTEEKINIFSLEDLNLKVKEVAKWE